MHSLGSLFKDAEKKEEITFASFVFNYTQTRA
jgi:hypothetical protein